MNWRKRPKLEIFKPEINPFSIEVAIKNNGNSSAVNCYVRITLHKADEDVISAPRNAYITKENPKSKIFEDYVTWGISPNPVRINIPPHLSDRANIGEVVTDSSKGQILRIASENTYKPPRVHLVVSIDKHYSGQFIFGADNCRPKMKNFRISFYENDNKLVGKIELD